MEELIAPNEQLHHIVLRQVLWQKRKKVCVQRRCILIRQFKYVVELIDLNAPWTNTQHVDWSLSCTNPRDPADVKAIGSESVGERVVTMPSLVTKSTPKHVLRNHI